MHLLYLDESGSTDANHFVIAGLLVHWRSVEPLKAALEQRVRSRLPDSEDMELHAGQMRTGRRRWSRNRRDVRSQLTDDIVELLVGHSTSSEHPLTLLGIVAERTTAPDPDLYERCYRAMFEICHRRFRSRRDSSRYLIIADKTRLESVIQSLANPAISSPMRSNQRQEELPYLLEVPLFIDSRMSRLVQLADFVAHWIYRAYEHGDASNLDRILPAFERDEGRLSGLIHLANEPGRCACVACAFGE